MEKRFWKVKKSTRRGKQLSLYLSERAGSLVGMSVHWLVGLPAYRPVGLPAYRLVGLPAYRLVGLPTNRLVGLLPHEEKVLKTVESTVLALDFVEFYFPRTHR